MHRIFSKRESTNAAMISSLKHGTDASNSSASDDDPMTEFPRLMQQLTAAEEKLKCAENLLMRHTHALSELVETSKEIQAMTTDTSKDSTENNAIVSEQKVFADSIATFRVTAIAPIQALLASFPQLKHRIDHRQSALSTWRRYMKKVEDIRGDATRLHRNKQKCTAAYERFVQLDKDVQREMGHVLAVDIGLVIQVPLLQLVDAQQLWATTMQSTSKHLRNSIAVAQVAPLTSPPNLKLDRSNNNRENLHGTCPDDANPAQRTSSFKHLSVGESSSLQNPLAVSFAADNVLDKTRSLRPKKQHTYGTRTWQIHQQVKQTLAAKEDVADAIHLPPGYTKEEWIAVHVIDFYNEISLLYGTISELCTATTCPEMAAGPSFSYLWADDNGGAPTACPAPVYVSKLLTWVDDKISDPTVFPDHGFETNKAFAAASRTILKRLFRVYAHIYHHHEKDFITLHADGHLHLSFKRFVAFVREFDLVEAKELNALRKLIFAT
ncbi:hypothetical protein LEN26_005685 [Aphanomyces euteiches]|nr:hypothetical protein AeMF1_000282 [Aphanomyces euteiches]KAH9137540.1 hypothetical protein LEN26_005685 [Aphanomyces euteiches]KAH9196852.1 hypothetical protein AeNC1_001166 [Aphanomyces euteiches]